GVPFSGTIDAVEATVVGGDGRTIPVIITGRRSHDGEEGSLLLHWELQEASHPGDASAAAAPNVGTPAEEQLRVITQAMVDVAAQESPDAVLEAVVRQACAVVAGCDEAGVALVRGRRGVEASVGSGPLAVSCGQ